MIDKLSYEYVTLEVGPEDVINGMLEEVEDGWMVTNGYNETYGFKDHDVVDVDVDVNYKIIYLHRVKMMNAMSIEELLEEHEKILKKMEIIESDKSVYLNVWDFVDVLNESNPPVCYNGVEFGFGHSLKGNEPEKFNEMFKEWAKEADPIDIPEYFNLKRRLYEIEVILDERDYWL